MPDQKTPENRGSENPQHQKQDITQNKPSHQNQGNETFYPDQQKKQPSTGSRESEKSGQRHEEHSRKVS